MRKMGRYGDVKESWSKDRGVVTTGRGIRYIQHDVVWVCIRHHLCPGGSDRVMLWAKGEQGGIGYDVGWHDHRGREQSGDVGMFRRQIQ